MDPITPCVEICYLGMCGMCHAVVPHSPFSTNMNYTYVHGRLLPQVAALEIYQYLISKDSIVNFLGKVFIYFLACHQDMSCWIILVSPER